MKSIPTLSKAHWLMSAAEQTISDRQMTFRKRPRPTYSMASITVAFLGLSHIAQVGRRGDAGPMMTQPCNMGPIYCISYL